LPPPRHSIILEHASLELVPRKYRQHASCKTVEYRFGTPADMQILDDNYHHEIITKLADHEKRGRPDIVHLALLDITSTPAFMEGLVEVYVHTILDQTIGFSSGVRLPRTLPRFCGVFSKILSGKQGGKETELFEYKSRQSSIDLVSQIGREKVICFTTQGRERDILSTVATASSDTTWIVGGFPRGHFREDVKSAADEIVSISKHSLAAHVVTARLCFAIERIS
jgi:rRNA small subunit pseudouridine methyltransferase Nep1